MNVPYYYLKKINYSKVKRNKWLTQINSFYLSVLFYTRTSVKVKFYISYITIFIYFHQICKYISFNFIK